MTKSTKYHMKTPPDYQAGSGIAPTYKQLGVAYVVSSTVHGVPHSFLARGRCKTIFWVVCLLCGVAALVVNMTFLVTKYVQFLPSTRITVSHNRSLAFPAVTICNTNPIKSSAVAHSARLVALLESWGVIDVSGNATRKKRSVDLDSDAIATHKDQRAHSRIHHISKRSSGTECSFLEIYNTSHGLATLCEPHLDISDTTSDGCLQEACNHVTAGQDQYNVINFEVYTVAVKRIPYKRVLLYQDGVHCSFHSCNLPLDDSALMLSDSLGGRDIYVRAHNECLTDPCINGQCEDTDLYYQCICDPGYIGFNCDTEIDECESEPCQNGGICQDFINSYNCTCPAGYRAVDCSLVQSGYNQYGDTLCDGEDLLPQSVNQTVAECEALCEATIGCIAFSYTLLPATDPVCALRAQCITMVTQENVVAYVKLTPSEGYSAYVDVECSGNDIKPSSTVTASAWDCSRECDELVSCVAFVYIESLTGCYVKSACDTSALTAKDSSGGYKVYLKTGRAGSCSFPRARIPCPGSYTNITSAQCQALKGHYCCYDDSQADVPPCYLDTLFDLQHNHIHTALRAAQKAPGSPVLYDLWVGDEFIPDLESEVGTEYYSTEDSETEVYKSPLVDCAWNRARKVYTTVHSDGEEKMYFLFDGNNKDKSSWYTSGQLLSSSYTDALSSTTYEEFDMDGDFTGDARRRWYINDQFAGCTFDSGWFVVLDTDHTGSCPWDNEADLPVFMYSKKETVDLNRRFVFGETFFIKAKLNDYNLGGNCVSSCLYMSDGSYQSCIGCNVYVRCTSQVLTYHVCHKDLRFDGYSRSCKDSSNTCSGDKSSGACIPVNECETNTECLNGGTCSMVSNGWECLCVSGYTGIYCQNCADFTGETNLYGSSQLVLTWTADSQATVYADGTELHSSSTDDWSEVVESRLPCGTLMVAFSLTDTDGGSSGLLASYGDGVWSSGVEGSSLKCTSDSGVVGSGDWNLYEYDDSAWVTPTIVGNNGDSPWGNLDQFSSSAKWVWTGDGASQIYCRLYMCPDPTEMLLLADDTVEVYADGINVRNSNYGSGAITVHVPCDTNQLALKVSQGSGSMGLLVKYGSEWASGDKEAGLVCSGDASTGNTDYWKYSGYDISAWQSPSVVSHPVAPPGEFGAAQWVWAEGGTGTIYCINQIVPPTTTTVTTTPMVTTVTTTTFTFFSSHPERNEYPPTEDFLREEDIMTLLAGMDEVTKRKLGYSLNDLVTECDFSGQPCTESDFSWFFDAVYGNCYVFNSGWERTDNTTDYSSSHQGGRHGLTVVLDIGQYEYIQDVGEAAGAVVVVHNPDDMPFPEDEGITAVPGKLTSVGIKKIDISRLPAPHGDCEENIERNRSRSLFEDLYPVKYSVSSCYKTCYQKYVVQTCGCGDPQYPIEGKVFDGQEIIPCNARNMTQDDCKYSVTKLYINDELDCYCPNPCQDSTYEYKVSSADWPALVSEACVFSDMRAELTAEGVTGLSDKQLKSNLVRIQVFYETLSSERLLEYPAYRLAKLFWDIGGILGLWLGCSVLSIVELLELAVDALVLLCYKLTKRKYWALPIKAKNSNNFDDLSSEEGRRTNKKVKFSKEGKLMYSHGGGQQTGNGQVAPVGDPGGGVNNQALPLQRKVSVPGYLLQTKGNW